jgi:hypothetical protein
MNRSDDSKPQVDDTADHGAPARPRRTAAWPELAIAESSPIRRARAAAMGTDRLEILGRIVQARRSSSRSGDILLHLFPVLASVSDSQPVAFRGIPAQRLSMSSS